jgi:hypothetical protein
MGAYRLASLPRRRSKEGAPCAAFVCLRADGTLATRCRCTVASLSGRERRRRGKGIGTGGAPMGDLAKRGADSHRETDGRGILDRMTKLVGGARGRAAIFLVLSAPGCRPASRGAGAAPQAQPSSASLRFRECMAPVEQLRRTTDALAATLSAAAQRSADRVGELAEESKAALTVATASIDRKASPEDTQAALDNSRRISTALTVAAGEMEKANLTNHQFTASYGAIYAKLTSALEDCKKIVALQGEIDDDEERLRGVERLQEQRATVAAIQESLAPFVVPAPAQVAPHRCSSDYECGLGQRCAKPEYQSSGTCMATVTSVGTPVFHAPRPDSVETAGPGTCQVDPDCPAAFRCMSGNCVR